MRPRAQLVKNVRSKWADFFCRNLNTSPARPVQPSTTETRQSHPRAAAKTACQRDSTTTMEGNNNEENNPQSRLRRDRAFGLRADKHDHHGVDDDQSRHD